MKQNNKIFEDSLKKAAEVANLLKPMLEAEEKLVASLGNQIKELDPEAFKDIQKMQDLAKSGNPFAVLDYHKKIAGKYANKNSEENK
jgi:hypothetical protein